MKEVLLKVLKNNQGVKYRLRYKDYPEGVWTLPCLLLDYRIDNFCEDYSLESVELIYSSGHKEIITNESF